MVFAAAGDVEIIGQTCNKFERARERLIFLSQNNLLPATEDLHFPGLKAKLLWQANRLAVARAKHLGDGHRHPPCIYGKYTLVQKASQGSQEPGSIKLLSWYDQFICDERYEPYAHSHHQSSHRRSTPNIRTSFRGADRAKAPTGCQRLQGRAKDNFCRACPPHAKGRRHSRARQRQLSPPEDPRNGKALQSRRSRSRQVRRRLPLLRRERREIPDR